MSDVVRKLEYFRSEINKATASYAAWKSFHDICVENKDAYKSFNRNATYWNITQYALQQSFFITLGRIFDTNSKSVSIFRLVRTCKGNIREFSKPSLRKRKGNEDWVDSYIDQAYEVTSRDFERLRMEIKPYKQTFDDNFKPIRHQVFAHFDGTSASCTQTLFGKVKISECEDILGFLNQVYRYVLELYNNGRLISLDERNLDIEEKLRSDLSEISTHLANA
ncbi:MAG: hypothetical protein OIF55_06660 [Amphritea sp.]|nr:hypothetical protein [Amphritea sp.]